MSRIGIYGGTFDPIHNGHIYLAVQAKEQLKLDEIWWIPSGNPPHKDDEISSRIMRYEMCRLALKEHEGFVLKDLEMMRSGQCYSYELMELIRALCPEDELFFIMGEDSLVLFDTWRKPERIAGCASLVAAIRKDSPGNGRIEEVARQVETNYNTHIFLLKTRDVPISSTDIRQRAAKGQAIDELVPEAVREYIISHELYRRHFEPDWKEIKSALREKLKPSRYTHTIGVMETAACLAMRYGMPVSKLRLAGLLHDCAKGYDNDKLLSLCKKYGINVSKAEKLSPHLLHSKVGEYLAKHKYGVKDKEVLRAIRYHTTGRPGMGLCEQIVFVADYIEPNRNRAKRLEEIRQVAFWDLDVCTLMILEDTIDYLKQQKQPMDEATVQTWEHYRKSVEQKQKEQYGIGQD